MVNEASRNPLNEVPERLDALSGNRGLACDDILDLGGPSAATGLGTREIRTPSRGGRMRERKVGKAAPRRVNFLYERLVRGSGRQPAGIVGEVAVRPGVTGAWARILLQGGKYPDVPHPAGPADYFGGPVAFFTDAAPDALAREVEPVVAGPEEPGPLVSPMERVGIKDVYTRTGNTHLTPEAKTRIAAIVQLALAQEQRENP